MCTLSDMTSWSEDYDSGAFLNQVSRRLSELKPRLKRILQRLLVIELAELRSNYPDFTVEEIAQVLKSLN